MPVTVYRVQDKEGNGPFWENHVKEALASLGRNPYMHSGDAYPNWNEDIDIWEAIADRYCCDKLRGGCLSIADILHWFDLDVCQAMERIGGAVLALYEVADGKAFAGQRQVAFDPERAKLIKTMPLYDAVRKYDMEAAKIADLGISPTWTVIQGGH